MTIQEEAIFFILIFCRAASIVVIDYEALIIPGFKYDHWNEGQRKLLSLC